jgi:hypothetical protein
MKVFICFLILLASFGSGFAQHQNIVFKYENYENYQITQLKTKAKTLKATAFSQITSYKNPTDSISESFFTDGNIKSIILKDRQSKQIEKRYTYLDSDAHVLSEVFATDRSTGKLKSIARYFYGKSGLDSSIINLYNGEVEKSFYTTVPPFNKVVKIRKELSNSYTLTRCDQEGKKISEVTYARNGMQVSFTSYQYDYRGNNISIATNNDGQSNLTVLNTYNDDNALVEQQRNLQKLVYNYNALNQKTEEILYNQDNTIDRKILFFYKQDGNIDSTVEYSQSATAFVNFDKYGQEREKYVTNVNTYNDGQLTRTIYNGTLKTHELVLYQQDRIVAYHDYIYDAQKRIIKQTDFTEYPGIVIKTVNEYTGSCKLPSKVLVYWGNTLYSKTDFRLLTGCKIIDRKSVFPSSMYLEGNDDPGPRGKDSLKTMFDGRKRLVGEQLSNTLTGVDYDIKIIYSGDKVIQVLLDGRLYNFNKDGELISTYYKGFLENKYTYKYDSRGNWISMKKTTLRDNSSSYTVTEREITYY